MSYVRKWEFGPNGDEEDYGEGADQAGEELGKMFFERIHEISPDSQAVKTIKSIIEWINHGSETGLS